MFAVVLPFNLVKFLLERVVSLRMLENFWEVMGNIDIKISPVELVDDVIFNS